MAKPGRRLGVIRGLLTLMLWLNVLGLVAAGLVKVLGSIVTDFPVRADLVYGAQYGTLRQANQQLWPVSVEVYVQQPSTWQTVLGLFSHGLAAAIASVVMIVLARRLVDLAIRTHPFTPGMVTALRRLGITVLAGGLVAEVVRSAAAVLLYRSTVRGGSAFADVDWRISLWWLLLGVVVLAFGEVVEHGCALRAELDEVI